MTTHNGALNTQDATSGQRHIWIQRHFANGPSLWTCVYCGEVSYHDLPDAKGCLAPQSTKDSP